jgi:hypothetical protein
LILKSKVIRKTSEKIIMPKLMVGGDGAQVP